MRATVAHELPLDLTPHQFFCRLGLTLQESQVMTMAAVEGRPYQEIANEFPMPLTKVTFIMHSSFNKLKQSQDLPKEAIFKAGQAAKLWWHYKFKCYEQDVFALKKELAQKDDANKTLKEVNTKLKGKIDELKLEFFQARGV